MSPRERVLVWVEGPLSLVGMFLPHGSKSFVCSRTTSPVGQHSPPCPFPGCGASRGRWAACSAAGGLAERGAAPSPAHRCPRSFPGLGTATGTGVTAGCGEGAGARVLARECVPGCLGVPGWAAEHGEGHGSPRQRPAGSEPRTKPPGKLRGEQRQLAADPPGPRWFPPENRNSNTPSLRPSSPLLYSPAFLQSPPPPSAPSPPLALGRTKKAPAVRVCVCACVCVCVCRGGWSGVGLKSRDYSSPRRRRLLSPDADF